MNPDAVTALAYTGAGGVAVKALDLLLKWHTGQHDGTLAEMEAARKIGAELRDELRKQLEELRIETEELNSKLVTSEKERLEMKALYEKSENLRKDCEAELRLLRKATDANNERRDTETDRHENFEKSQKRRRP